MKLELTIRRPDDMHVHLRDGQILKHVAQETARRYGRAIVMPNLIPPITNVDVANDYYEQIVLATEDKFPFQPLMTLYLTDHTTCEDVRQVLDSELVVAFKLYPAGATTNSDAGVKSLLGLWDVIGEMERFNIPLLLHGESTDPDVDIFDREAVFIEQHLSKIVHDFPSLRVVLEHITTKESTQFVLDAPNVYGTITPHHLILNRNDLFKGGICPHHYCLPILKAEEHRRALIEAVRLGTAKIFLGTDSAPHTTERKESACGCAGIYNPYSIEILAELFEEEKMLGLLESFTSEFGAWFYNIPVNKETITLVHEPWEIETETWVNADYSINKPISQILRPFKAGETIQWRLVE